MEKEKQNIRYMTILKALGIIAVVIGHADSPARDMVYLYHMALFFFVAGYFYKDVNTQKPLIFIKKRIFSLYLPYVGLGLVFLYLHNTLFRLGIYSDHVGFGDVFSRLYTNTDLLNLTVRILKFGHEEQLLGALWFLNVLFAVSIMFLLISYLIHAFIKKDNEYVRFIAVGILFVIGMTNLHEGRDLPNLLNLSMICTMVFYFGYLFRKWEHKIIFNLYFALVAAGILYISNMYGKVDLRAYQVTSPVFFLVCSLLGIYVNIYVAKWLDTKLKGNTLTFIGESSLYIMAFHFLAFKLALIPQIIIYNMPFDLIAKFPVINGYGGWWIPYSLVGIAVPTLVRYLVILVKNKISSKPIPETNTKALQY